MPDNPRTYIVSSHTRWDRSHPFVLNLSKHAFEE